MQSFAHPFRFQNGQVVKMTVATDAFAAQIISAAVQTGKGELPLIPSFGSNAPEFTAVDTSGLIYSLSAFHPSIQISRITETVDPETEIVRVRVSFNRSE